MFLGCLAKKEIFQSKNVLFIYPALNPGHGSDSPGNNRGYPLDQGQGQRIQVLNPGCPGSNPTCVCLPLP